MDETLYEAMSETPWNRNWSREFFDLMADQALVKLALPVWYTGEDYQEALGKLVGQIYAAAPLGTSRKGIERVLDRFSYHQLLRYCHALDLRLARERLA